MFSVNTQQKGLEKKKRWHAFCYLSFEMIIEKESQKNNNFIIYNFNEHGSIMKDITGM